MQHNLLLVTLGAPENTIGDHYAVTLRVEHFLVDNRFAGYATRFLHSPAASYRVDSSYWLDTRLLVPHGAALVTSEIYRQLLETYQGESEWQTEGEWNFIDMDGNVCDKWFVGRKWVVVVDYQKA